MASSSCSQISPHFAILSPLQPTALPYPPARLPAKASGTENTEHCLQWSRTTDSIDITPPLFSGFGSTGEATIGNRFRTGLTGAENTRFIPVPRFLSAAGFTTFARRCYTADPKPGSS